MTSHAAQLLVLVGLLLLAAGCSRPLDTAVASANAAAVAIEAAHTTLARRYREDQLDAARRVRGERSDPTTRAEQRDRVQTVRARYAPLWEAYRAARQSWLAAVDVLVAARAAENAGLAVDVATVTDALQHLAAASAHLVSSVRALEREP